VLLVSSDTLSTVERTEEVIRSGRTRDQRTVSLMRELLHDHADVDGIVGTPAAESEPEDDDPVA
jgi:hypothetical protein